MSSWLDAQLFVKLSKCEFHTTQIDYLGFRISEGYRNGSTKGSGGVGLATSQNEKTVTEFFQFCEFL